MSSFHEQSYVLHSQHIENQINDPSENSRIQTWLAHDTVNYWRHQRMYQNIDILLKSYPNSSWLTVGDGSFGNDAHYLKEHGIKALSTDISDKLLKQAKEIGFIDDYKQENAENLTFHDEQFDFVFCKESYHHFPRPPIALYEMIRVAKIGVVLIEPNDQVINPTFFQKLVLLCNNSKLSKIFSLESEGNRFEEVGNYLYPLSERELEKVAIGLNSKYLVTKGMNDHYIKGVESEKIGERGPLYFKIKNIIILKNLLCKIRLRQFGILTCIIFKKDVPQETVDLFITAGFKVKKLPPNPYINQ